MKLLIKLGVLFLALTLLLSFNMAIAEDVTVDFASLTTGKSGTLSQGETSFAKHNIDDDWGDILDLNKHSLTLKKGKSATLKAIRNPSGKAITVKWKSTNSKIAKVSSTGKVTAVAPGVAVITATSSKYRGYCDITGHSDVCYVTVQGSSKDPKALSSSDRTFYYGKKSLKVPGRSANYTKSLAAIKKSIGGYSYTDDEEYGGGYEGLLFGSKNVSKAHSDIYMYLNEKGGKIGFGFVARGKSPIKTKRGISVGAKKSVVQKKYGLPTQIATYKENGKTYEQLVYDSYSLSSGRVQYTRLFFTFQKSKGTVARINLFCGGDYL